MNKLTKNTIFGFAGAAAVALTLSAVAPAMAATPNQNAFGAQDRASSDIQILSNQQDSSHYRAQQNIQASIALQLSVDSVLRNQARDEAQARSEAQLNVAAETTGSHTSDSRRSNSSTRAELGANIASANRTNEASGQGAAATEVATTTGARANSDSGNTSWRNGRYNSSVGVGVGVGADLRGGRANSYQTDDNGGDLSLGLGIGALLGR